MTLTVVTRQLLQQKQPPEVFYEKGFPKNFWKVHMKISVPESLFNKIADLSL